MADYTSSNTGAVIDAAVDYVEILDNYLTISSNELIITGQTGVGSDTVLLNLKANNSAGFAGNVLRFTDTDPTAVQNGSMGKVQWFSTTTGAVVAEINGKNDDATPDGQLIISTAAGASLTQRIDINADGDIQFFNATGTSRDLHWDATDSRLGINVTNPTEALDVLGNANFTGTVTASGDVAIGTSSAGTFRTKIKHSAASVTTGLGIEASANDSVLRVFHSGSLAGFNATYSSTGAYVPMVFNVGSGGEAVRISTAGLVGINNSSPVEMLTVGDTSDTNVRVQFLSSASGANTIQFGDGTGTAAYRGYINYTHSDDALAFAAAGSEAMRIVSGNVGINETNPQFKLDVENVGGDAIRINAGADFSGLRLTSTAGEWSVRTASDALIFYDVTSASEVGRFDSSGKFGIGANSIDSDALLHLKSTQPNIRFEDTDDSKSWRLEAGSVFKLQNVTTGSEVFRVDQSSNLLVGTADNEPYNNNTGNADDNGIALSGGGWLASSRFNGVAAYFNRTNTTGDIVTINYNGATKGTIGSDGSILYIGSGEGTDAYLGFGNDIIRPVTSAGASRDAAIEIWATLECASETSTCQITFH
jgi:hypothetical protein